jgi:hypothetical protein
MNVQFEPHELDQQRRIKTAFDPAWLLNPHKVFPLEIAAQCLAASSAGDRGRARRPRRRRDRLRASRWPSRAMDQARPAAAGAGGAHRLTAT